MAKSLTELAEPHPIKVHLQCLPTCVVLASTKDAKPCRKQHNSDVRGGGKQVSLLNAQNSDASTDLLHRFKQSLCDAKKAFHQSQMSAGSNKESVLQKLVPKLLVIALSSHITMFV